MFISSKQDAICSFLAETPISLLAGSDANLMHIAADVPDTGFAMKTAIALGYGRYIAKPGAAYNNETPLHVAVRRGNIRAIREMEQYINAELLTQTVINECVVLAARFGQDLILAFLLDRVKPTEPAITASINEVAQYRHSRAGLVLLERYKEYVAPLFPHLVTEALRLKPRRGEMLEFVRQIVRVCPTVVNVTGKRKRTALHLAVTYRTADALQFTRFLIDNSASLNAVDEDDLTPPQVAYTCNNRGALCMLLAVPNCPILWQRRRRSPSLYNRIVIGKDVQLLDMMFTGNKYLRVDPEVIRCVMADRNFVLFEHMVKTYPGTTIARGRLGRNILMLAIYEKVPIIYIETLLEYGAQDIDACDDMGNTALHYAATNGSRAVIMLLLKKERASSFTRNAIGDLPVDCGPLFDVHAQTRLLLVSKQLVSMAKSTTIAHLRRRASTDVLMFMITPPTMLEYALDAIRLTSQTTAIRRVQN